MLPTEIEFSFNNNEYRMTRMDAMSSFHVSRKLAPVLTSMGSTVFSVLRARDEGKDDAALDEVMMVAGPVADVLSKMSNEDVEYVIRTCMQSVRRKAMDKYAPMVSSTGAFMFQDMTMPEMIRLTVEVVRLSLSDFFGMALGEAAS